MKSKNLLFIFCLAIILSTTIGYCYEWDNTKSYDSKDRSITVSNSFLKLIDLDAIAKVTPTTPHVNYVIRGKDRLVAEFTIESYLTYKEKVWDNMKFYNKNSKNAEIEREYKIRYKELEPYDYPNYVEACKDTGKINKTDGKPIWNCTYTYAPITKLKPVWKDLDTKADLKKGILEIGIFADVKAGDNVEFIPTWFGVSMPEYAVWTDSYNNGLVAYFDGNITTNMVTSYPQVNLSFSEGSPSSGIEESCLIGKCLNSTPSNDWKIAANEITNFSKDYTWNFWVKGVNTGGGYPFFFCYNIGTGNTNMGWNSPTDVYVGPNIDGVGSASIGTPNISEWFMITIKRNNTDGNLTVYYDGEPRLEGTTGVMQDYQSNIILGDHCNGIFDWEGYFDELGYWNRTLNDFEIQDLYNGGAGLTYKAPASTETLVITVSLVSPANDTSTTSTFHYFNSSGIVTHGNFSNATLYLWKTGTTLTNFTAFTGFVNDTQINQSLTLTEGNWKWNVDYCGMNESNEAQCAIATNNNTLIIDTTYPLVNITYPKNTSYDAVITALNFTASDLNLKTCKFDNMTLNQTTSCTLNMTGNNSHQGSNRWILWANDTAGNLNGTSVDFYVDSIYPLINFTAPTPNDLVNTSNPNFTVAVNVTETNLENITFYLYNSTNDLINETNLSTSPSFFGFESNTLEGWQSQDSAPAKAIAIPCINGARCFPTEGSYGVNLSTQNSGITKTFTRLKDIYFDVRTREGSGNYNITLKVNGVIYNNTLPDINSSLSYAFNPPIEGATVVIHSRSCSSLCVYDDMFTIDNITINKEKAQLAYYNLTTGTYYYNVTATDIVNNKNSTETRNINIDTELPAVFVYEPKTMGLVYPNQNVSINFSAYDRVGNLEGCWFNYNGTNFTIPCTTNNTMLLNKPNFLTFFANHTAGGYNSTTHYWNYTAFISNYSFVGLTYSGFAVPFSINFSLDSSAFSGINMKLSYNGTNYTMTSSDAGDDKRYTYILSVPTTTTEVNRSFFYTFELTNTSGTTTLETKQFNQTIKSFLIDNCSTNINPILNMRMIDEETLLAINGTIEINVHLYSQSTNELVNSYNDTFNYDNNFSAWSTICTSNFTGVFKMAYTIRHYGNQSIYFKKFRVAQNQTISNQTRPVNITLYNLLLSSGYSFVIKAREASQTTNLLVEAYKQYVGLDNYSLVESSITDSDGNTILHLTPSSVKYRFVVSYEGRVISIQDTQQMICNNLATLDCQTTLNLEGDVGGITDYDSFGNIIGSFNFNTTSQVFKFSFASADGNSHAVNLHIVKSDAFGNTTIYNGTYTGSAGILSTIIPAAYSNTTILAYITSDGLAVGRTFFSNYPKQNWYGADIILELLMFSSLVLLLIAHPIMIVIGAMLGLVFSVLLIFISDGSLSGILASLVYFVIAGGIIIWQIGRRL